ncbi:phage tail tape measure protein, partial [Salmonella enterica subsp. enterica]|nr:phage tail tape measure protein [Salmonella enterica subsp. enterica]ECE6544856.1 phage tail tape measure protein [Salmonella enterica subsp. enterica]
RFEQHNHVTIQNDGANGNIGPGALKAVYDIASKATMDILNKQGRDGGMLNGGRR